MKGITLIGMPAAGKSTVGQLLAKKLNWPLYDIDKMIEQTEGQKLPQIIKEKGRRYFTGLEAGYVCDLKLENAVLSPGGSIIYGRKCHAHMKKFTHVVYLNAPIELIQERLADDPNNERGVVGLENGGLEKLFAERTPRYEILADIEVKVNGKTPAETTQEIIRLAKLKSR